MMGYYPPINLIGINHLPTILKSKLIVIDSFDPYKPIQFFSDIRCRTKPPCHRNKVNHLHHSCCHHVDH